MKEIFYKLGEYKIIESDTGELRWEAHFGVGQLKEGRCFRKGMILFIGPPESQHNGFLKLEFISHLKGFQDWRKTKYYCENLDIYHCKTGKKVTREEMRLWMFAQGRESETMDLVSGSDEDLNDSSSLMPGESVNFRLQKYEINKRMNGKLEWKTYSGSSSLRTGVCTTIEDILFLGPWKDEQTDLSKQQFSSSLSQLPEWNQTRYYCPRLSLNECKSVNLLTGKKRWWREKVASTARKRDSGDGYKNTPESKIPKDTKQGIFKTKISPILDSFGNRKTHHRERHYSSRFRFKKADISKSITIFRGTGISKWIICSVAIIFLIIVIFITFLTGYWKEHRDRVYYKEGGHTSSHRRNH